MNGWAAIMISYFFGLLEIAVEFIFFTEATGKRGKIGRAVPFVILGCFASHLQGALLPKLLLLAAAFFLYGFFRLKENGWFCIFYAVLTIAIMRLCYGIVQGITSFLAPFLYVRNPAVCGWVFLIAGELFSLGLSVLCYWAVLKYLRGQEGGFCQMGDPAQWVVFLTPLLLILTVGQSIGHTVYGNTVTFSQGALLSDRNDFSMVAVQLAAVASVFSILYIYRKWNERFFLDVKLSAVEQQRNFQDQYVKAAQNRYQSTKSLRHDIKNHLAVVKGLLEKGDFERARAYIDEMDGAAAGLSFPFRTDHPVLDILLERKGALAKERGIRLDSTLRVPSPCSVTDTDLCILLSNALDNAIRACQEADVGEDKYIRLSGRRQGDFLLIEMENSFSGGGDLKQGTGLSNIKWTAKRYGGSADVRTKGKAFYLDILLDISHQPQGFSHQIH